jgi:hypothetical protein
MFVVHYGASLAGKAVGVRFGNGSANCRCRILNQDGVAKGADYGTGFSIGGGAGGWNLLPPRHRQIERRR